MHTPGKNRQAFLYFLAALAVSAATPAYAGELYRWVDKNGVTQYSETKPAQQKTQTIRIQQSENTQPSRATAPSSKSNDQKEAEFRQRQNQRAEQAEQEQRAQQERERAAARCGDARGNLADLEKANRIFSYDEKGNRVYRDNKERSAILDEARARVSSLCR